MFLISLIIIILDGVLIYYFPSYFNNLSLLYPMLTITLNVTLYSYSKNYLKDALILGMIYDLCYSSIFLYNTLIFLLLAKINKKILNYFHSTMFNKIIILIINIFIYDFINFFIIYFSRYNLVTFNDLFYKFYHSLLLNILSLFIIQFILKKMFHKHKI